jgi:hypothetical protein
MFGLLFLFSMYSLCISTVRIPLMVHSMQFYVIKFVRDLRQVGGFLRFSQHIKLTATIRNAIESGVKHHKTKKNIFLSFFNIYLLVTSPLRVNFGCFRKFSQGTVENVYEYKMIHSSTLTFGFSEDTIRYSS